MADLYYPESLKNALNNAWIDDEAISAIRFNIFTKPEARRSEFDKSIILYMPEQLANPTNISWDSAAIGSGGQAQLDKGFVRRMTSLYNTGSRKLDEFMTSLGSTVGGGSDASGETLAALEHREIKNPYLKMAFRGINFRNFEYLFKFTPHTQQESETIYEIIQSFRQAALPSAPGGPGGGPDPQTFKLEYPMELGIEYLYQGSGGSGDTATSEHRWLNKFKKCVITDLSINYTGAGFYASMRNGFPAQTELRIQFSEIDLVYREDIKLNEASF